MTDNPALKTCPFCHGSGHKDDAKATLQGVCGNLRNDGYLVPLSVLTRAIEFLPTLEPQGYNEWIDTYKVTNGPYAYSNADMVMSFNAGQAKSKANALELEALEIVSQAQLRDWAGIIEGKEKHIKELEAKIAAWEAIEKGRV